MMILLVDESTVWYQFFLLLTSPTICFASHFTAKSFRRYLKDGKLYTLHAIEKQHNWGL